MPDNEPLALDALRQWETVREELASGAALFPVPYIPALRLNGLMSRSSAAYRVV